MNINLQRDLNIRCVSELKDQLSAGLKTGDPIIINCSNVTTVDTAVLQMLAAFSQQVALKQCLVEWRGMPEVFLNTVKMMGLIDSLSLDK